MLDLLASAGADMTLSRARKWADTVCTRFFY